MQIAEWTEEAIVSAFVRGLPVCQKLIESGQVSDKAYCVYNSDMPHYFDHLWSDGDGAEATLLSICAMHGHTQLIELLLDHGFHISQRETNELTPLGSNSAASQVDIYRLLIERGARMDSVALSSPAMHLAAQCGTPEILEILLNAGQDVNVDEDGETPLHTAAGCGTLENIQWLLEHGADLWMESGGGRSVLDCSIWNKNSAVFDYLLQRYLDSEPPGHWKEDTLTNAAHACNLKACQKLLDLGASINGNPHSLETPLFKSMGGGYHGTCLQSIFDLLMEHGAELYVGDASKECSCFKPD